MGDAYGTGIVQKMSQAELDENANQKKISTIAVPTKTNEEV